MLRNFSASFRFHSCRSRFSISHSCLWTRFVHAAAVMGSKKSSLAIASRKVKVLCGGFGLTGLVRGGEVSSLLGLFRICSCINEADCRCSAEPRWCSEVRELCLEGLGWCSEWLGSCSGWLDVCSKEPDLCPDERDLWCLEEPELWCSEEPDLWCSEEPDLSSHEPATKFDESMRRIFSPICDDEKKKEGDGNWIGIFDLLFDWGTQGDEWFEDDKYEKEGWANMYESMNVRLFEDWTSCWMKLGERGD